MKKVLVLGLVTLVAACASNETDPGSASASQMTEATAPLLDCSQHGSFTEDAMKALAGTYERVGATSNGLRSFTLGPLQDIPGWGGKNASYKREVAAPCVDPKSTIKPMMTDDGCAGQTGTITTLFDNPAIGAFLSFEDAAGLPFGKDFYFVTSSRLEADGRLSALCLVNGGTGESFLVVQKP